MRILLILAFTLLFKGISAQNSFYKNEFGFKSENDAYLATKQDRYYTNGLFITFRTAANKKTLADSVYMKQHLNEDRPLKKIWSFTLGQQIFNAQTGAVPDITFVDRPFAGYLFGAGSLQFFDKKENSGKLTFQVGTIGPSALGEDAQDFIHDTFGFYDINGWQYQIKDEIGLNLKLDFHQLFHRSTNKKVDFSYFYNLNLGTIYTGAGAGILFRTGNLNPLYHSVATNSNISTFLEPSVNDKELYFFLKPSLDLVIYNATVSGGLFRGDKGPITYGTKPVVFSQELGVAYAQKRWTLDFSILFKTREIKSVARPHQYGAVDIYYRF